MYARVKKQNECLITAKTYVDWSFTVLAQIRSVVIRMHQSRGHVLVLRSASRLGLSSRLSWTLAATAAVKPLWWGVMAFISCCCCNFLMTGCRVTIDIFLLPMHSAAFADALGTSGPNIRSRLWPPTSACHLLLETRHAHHWQRGYTPLLFVHSREDELKSLYSNNLKTNSSVRRSSKAKFLVPPRS